MDAHKNGRTFNVTLHHNGINKKFKERQINMNTKNVRELGFKIDWKNPMRFVFNFFLIQIH